MATATAPSKARRSATLRAVERSAVSFRSTRSAARKAQDEMDAKIRAARESGNTYREIAAAVGMSTAWVQNALHRSGHRPEPR